MELETRFYVAGTPLAATIHLPDKGNEGIVQGERAGIPQGLACFEEKYPMVLLLHGYTSYRNHDWIVLARALAERGIASLRFDHRGCGTDPVQRYCTRPSSEGPYDTRCAIDYCESLPFVDKDRIGMTGGSQGGIMSIIVAATDGRVKSIAPMACTASCGENIVKDWGDQAEAFLEEMREDARLTAATGLSRIIRTADDIGLHRPAGVADANTISSLLSPGTSPYVALESIRDLMNFNATEYIADVRCPIFIVHGADDGLKPEKHPERLFAMLPEDNENKRIKIYPNVDHGLFNCPNSDELVRDVANWFAETL